MKFLKKNCCVDYQKNVQIPFHPDPPFRTKLTPYSGDTDPPYS